MAKKVQMPDGTVLEFPDDTPQSVIDKVQRRETAGAASSEALNRALASSYAGQDVGQMGTLMRGLGGAKVALDRAALGLKGLVTDLSPEDKALLEQGKASVNQGGTATNVGNIAGDVAIGAVPGSWPSSVVRLDRSVGLRAAPRFGLGLVVLLRAEPVQCARACSSRAGLGAYPSMALDAKF